ncbi:MAG: FHA domain-containing protein, partial [Kiritimatiellae bacterium]|nr:FHA domain-containing protein [Kiritimatiellia bacterium]
MDRYSHLLIEAGQSKGTSFTIPQDGAQIGRSSKNDICINDEGLSRNQCRFEFREKRLWVVDLKSANSTRVNQAPIKETQLKKGDRILIGDTQILVLMTTVTPRLKVNDGSASKAPPKLVLEHPSAKARFAVMPIWILVLGWLTFLAYSVLRDDAGQADRGTGSDEIVATPLPTDSITASVTAPSEPAGPSEQYDNAGTSPDVGTSIASVAPTSRNGVPQFTPKTPSEPDSGGTDALKRSIVFKVMKQEYVPAQEALLSALAQSSTPQDRLVINEM